jgi:hypothetical protein
MDDPAEVNDGIKDPLTAVMPMVMAFRPTLRPDLRLRNLSLRQHLLLPLQLLRLPLNKVRRNFSLRFASQRANPLLLFERSTLHSLRVFDAFDAARLGLHVLGGAARMINVAARHFHLVASIGLGHVSGLEILRMKLKRRLDIG